MKTFCLTALTAVFMTSFSVCSMEAEENQPRTTKLHRAVNLGSTRLVRLLLRRGADVNAENRRGKTPLLIAAIKGQLNVARALIERGARLDLENYYDGTPLHAAAKNGNTAVVELLIEHGAEVDKPGEGSSSTPLHLASMNGHLDVVRILVRAGADVHKLHRGINAASIHFAVSSGQNPELVEFLINRGATVDELDWQGQTPLFKAIINILRGENIETNFEIAQLLVQNGADVNHRDNRWTLLHIAAATGNYRCAELLIRHGADVDATVFYADIRPLHLAMKPPQTNQGTHYTMFEFTTQDHFGQHYFGSTVYYLPVLNEYPKIIKLLLSVDADHSRHTLGEIQHLFPHADIVSKAQENRETRDQAIEAALDLPRDLSRLIISFEHHDHGPAQRSTRDDDAIFIADYIYIDSKFSAIALDKDSYQSQDNSTHQDATENKICRS